MLQTQLRMGLILYLIAATELSAQTDDFPAQEAAEAAAIGALAGIELSSTVVGLSSPDPLTMFIADAAGYSAGLALKYLPAPLVVPPDRALHPTTSDGCHREFALNQFKAPFSNLFGLVSFGSVLSNTRAAFDGVPDDGLVFNPVTGIPNNWGELGTPDIYHASTDVVLIARNSTIRSQFYSARCTAERIEAGECTGTGSDGNEFGEWERQPVTVQMPAGNHTINWEAHTLIDPVFDLGVSTILTASGLLSKYRSGELAAALAGRSAKAKKAAADNLDEGFLAKKLRVATEECTESAGAGAICGLTLVDYSNKVIGWSPFSLVTATRERQQLYTVYDIHPPTLEILEPTINLEAADFGGTFLSRVREQIFASVEADDACDRRFSLSNDLPNLLPLGESTVTWTVADLGPSPEGGNYSLSKTQTLVVADTQPPIIVPPPGRVIEVDPADFDDSDGISSSGVNPAVVDLGQPLVVDLADPAPVVGSNAPEFFPVNSRTEVTWTATDHGYPSANTSSATQLITVKRRGENTAPTASNTSATTLTSQPVDILLEASDRDLLDGRFDPLSFAITARPESGEFVAPLLPYFIEDYRTSPAGPYGDEFYLSGNRVKWLYDNVCRDPDLAQQDQKIRRDWVYKPRFVQVTDDGTLYMIDTYWRCNPSDATGGGPRVSKWTRDGAYLGQIDYGGTTDAFVLDQDNFIYTLSKQGAGSSTTLTLTQLRPNFDEPGVDVRADSWRFDFASAEGVPLSSSQLSYARVDSRRGIIYLNDRRRIFAYDVRNDLSNGVDESKNDMEDQFIGALNQGDMVIGCTSFGSSWTGFAMEVDSAGALYVADTCADRIHKFNPPTFDEEGQITLGDYVGWMGRCDASSNKACDEETGTSKGYACTDQTCIVNTSEGDGEGQFSTPVYLAMDPNDILYVADYANRRIQRFAPDGSFAGMAESTGTGVNQGSNPSFILGNIGPPKAVSVNSTQFFVVDQDESFIHVFETSPFKDITDDSATVTYVSRFDFHSSRDEFRFVATDGLDQSREATVSVRVDRNFRPPVVDDLSLKTDEDTPLSIALPFDDPDGIAGRDFNGLDTVTLRIADEPRFGDLEGEPPNVTYRPGPDFHGEDSFTYLANDERDDSELATVAITVNPVADPVRVTGIKPPARIGMGFPAVVMGSYFDDGAAEHDVTLSWGDGTVDGRGDFVDPDGDGDAPPRLEGVKLMERPGLDGVGMALGHHTWNNVGRYPVQLCLSDGQSQHCLEQAVQVERLANIAIGYAQDLVEAPGATTTLDLMIMNARPSNWDGLSARDLKLQQFEGNEMQVEAVTVVSGQGSCNPNRAVLCELEDLPPGGNVHLQLVLAPDSPAVYAPQDVFLGLELTTSTPAVQDSFLASKSVSFVVDLADDDNDGMSNQFERIYGLNAASASDATTDTDRDGLSNREEFEAGTDPTDRDTDNDGSPDGVDPDPLDPTVRLDSLPGDLNGDQRIDAGDILLLQRVLRGELPELSGLADINNDGTTDAADLLRLQLEVSAQ